MSDPQPGAVSRAQVAESLWKALLASELGPPSPPRVPQCSLGHEELTPVEGVRNAVPRRRQPQLFILGEAFSVSHRQLPNTGEGGGCDRGLWAM